LVGAFLQISSQEIDRRLAKAPVVYCLTLSLDVFMWVLYGVDLPRVQSIEQSKFRRKVGEEDGQ
jgi:hypothetical protein